MKLPFSSSITLALHRWRALGHAAVSVSGLVGMLLFEGWLNSVMLVLTAWPVLVASLARLTMRRSAR